MKPRKVVLMVEVLTDAPMSDMRSRAWWQCCVNLGATPQGLSGGGKVDPVYPLRVLQVQANVVREAKP